MQFKTNEEAVLEGFRKNNIKYFKPQEFECPCCKEYLMDMYCVKMLDVLRGYVGFPLVITSGYRCAKHNKEIGGAPESKHLLGQAVDIDIGKLNSSQIHMLIELGMPRFNGFGFGLGKLHFDVRKKPTAWGY